MECTVIATIEAEAHSYKANAVNLKGEVDIVKAASAT